MINLLLQYYCITEVKRYRLSLKVSIITSLLLMWELIWVVHYCLEERREERTKSPLERRLQMTLLFGQIWCEKCARHRVPPCQGFNVFKTLN